MAIRRFKSRATAGRKLKSGTLAQLTSAAAILTTAERGDGVAGTFDENARNVDPGVANVKNGTAYTIHGVALTGTYVIVTPATPTLTIADNGDGTGAVVTIAGSTAGSTNQVYTVSRSGGSWTLGGSRTGNGTVVVTLATGGYLVYVLSSLSGGYAISAVSTFSVTDSTLASGRVQQISDALVAELAAADLAGAFAETLAATRTYTTDLSLTVPVGTLSVSVVPSHTIRRRTSNGTWRRDVVLEILVRAHLTSDAVADDTTTDARMYLAEQIDDYLANPDHHGLTLPDGVVAWYVEPDDNRADMMVRADAGVIWLRDHLLTLRQITALIRVTYATDTEY